MKKRYIFILALAFFSACNETETISVKTQSNVNLSSAITVKETPNAEQPKSSFEKLISAQNSANEKQKWIAPNYKGLQLGKANEDDIIKIFGEPKSQGHPFDEEVSRNDEWMFHYENINDFDWRTEFLFDIRSKILKEVWLSPNYERPLTIEKAIEIYGNEYLVRSIENLCSSKKLTKVEYPFLIVYPQKGMFFWIREENYVDTIFYAAKCR